MLAAPTQHPGNRKRKRLQVRRCCAHALICESKLHSHAIVAMHGSLDGGIEPAQRTLSVMLPRWQMGPSGHCCEVRLEGAELLQKASAYAAVMFTRMRLCGMPCNMRCWWFQWCIMVDYDSQMRLISCRLP